MISAIKSKPGAPEQFRKAVKEINKRVKELEYDLAVKPDDLNQLVVTKEEEGFCIGTQFDDGVASTLLIGDTWFYRSPYDGVDHIVQGGYKEVVDNWVNQFLG